MEEPGTDETELTFVAEDVLAVCKEARSLPVPEKMG